MNHTPTPWAVEYVYCGKVTMVYARIYEVGHKSQSVGFAGIYKRTTKDEAIANAQFIVRACNAHDELVKTLGRVEANLTVDTATRLGIYKALKLARGE